MKHRLIRNTLLMAAVLLLPGCLAINAILGVASFVTSGPMQLAGTIYSVGEYTYEYAANDRTPDEVFLAKFDWLELNPEEEAAPLTGYAKAMRKTSMDGSEPFVRPALPLVASIKPEPGTSILSVSNKPDPSHKQTVSEPANHVSAAKTTPKRMVVATRGLARKPSPEPVVVAEAPRPAHTYIEHDTDPLLVRMNRLEHSLNQAEQMTRRQGTAHSLSIDQSEPGAGVSGAWSIRHTVMQHAPYTPAPAAQHIVVSAVTPPASI